MFVAVAREGRVEGHEFLNVCLVSGAQAFTGQF